MKEKRKKRIGKENHPGRLYNNVDHDYTVAAHNNDSIRPTTKAAAAAAQQWITIRIEGTQLFYPSCRVQCCWPCSSPKSQHHSN
jgi:hypothetical protein